MKIILAGGSGHVGTFLARTFHRDGHQVVVLSRKPTPAPWPTIPWYGHSLGPWVDELEGADVVINLAGRSVNCRYHAQNRREIIDSRVESTRVIGEALAQAKQPPRVWLQASTMSPDRGGPFDMLLRLVRLGLGGQNGNGRQYVSWIHETDFIRAIYWL